MKALVFIDWRLRRLWIARRRQHHGKWGVYLVLAGVCMCVHDRSDYRDWFARELLP